MYVIRFWIKWKRKGDLCQKIQQILYLIAFTAGWNSSFHANESIFKKLLNLIRKLRQRKYLQRDDNKEIIYSYIRIRQLYSYERAICVITYMSNTPNTLTSKPCSRDWSFLFSDGIVSFALIWLRKGKTTHRLKEEIRA